MDYCDIIPAPAAAKQTQKQASSSLLTCFNVAVLSSLICNEKEIDCNIVAVTGTFNRRGLEPVGLRNNGSYNHEV